jgi:hypothetical protein
MVIVASIIEAEADKVDRNLHSMTEQYVCEIRRMRLKSRRIEFELD